MKAKMQVIEFLGMQCTIDVRIPHGWIIVKNENLETMYVLKGILDSNDKKIPGCYTIQKEQRTEVVDGC